MKTREHIIEFIKKQKVSFIASVDEEGFPNIKAMLVPRKIEGNCFYSRGQRAKQPRWRGYLATAARVEYPAALLRYKFDAPTACCGVFDFTTNTSAMRSQQFIKNPKASIYFYSKGRFKYEGIMLTGTMEVLQDDETRQEIWRTGDTMFYKKGVTDPDYCVLKFTAIKGRYYCDLKTESFGIEDLK